MTVEGLALVQAHHELAAVPVGARGRHGHHTAVVPEQERLVVKGAAVDGVDSTS